MARRRTCHGASAADRPEAGASVPNLLSRHGSSHGEERSQRGLGLLGLLGLSEVQRHAGHVASWRQSKMDRRSNSRAVQGRQAPKHFRLVGWVEGFGG